MTDVEQVKCPQCNQWWYRKKGKDTNLTKIKEFITRIKVRADEGDNELAHRSKDALYLFTLNAIAQGCDNPKRLAEEALKADNIEFDEWYA